MSPRILTAIWAAAWLSFLAIAYSRADREPVQIVPAVVLDSSGPVGVASHGPMLLASIPANAPERVDRPGEVRFAVRTLSGQPTELVVFVAGSYTPGAVVGGRLYAEADASGRGLKVAWEDGQLSVDPDGSYGLTLAKPAADLLGQCERGWTLRFVVTAPDGLILKDKTEWVAFNPDPVR